MLTLTQSVGVLEFGNALTDVMLELLRCELGGVESMICVGESRVLCLQLAHEMLFRSRLEVEYLCTKEAGSVGCGRFHHRPESLLVVGHAGNDGGQ